LRAFKSGGRCELFNSSPEKILTVLKTSAISPGQLSRAFDAAPRDLIPNWRKGFEVAGFENFQKYQKLFALHDLELTHSI
jgi:hypothetical protein